MFTWLPQALSTLMTGGQVNDIKQEGKFVFDTNGSPIPFNALWSKGHGSKGKNKNCVLMFIAKWVDWNCSDDWQVGTLCEQL